MKMFECGCGHLIHFFIQGEVCYGTLGESLRGFMTFALLNCSLKHSILSFKLYLDS